MNMHISQDPDTGIACVTAIGTLTTDKVRESTLKIMEFTRREKIDKMIIDHRKLTLEINMLDIHQIPVLYEQLGVSKDVKIVLVLGNNHVNKDKIDFYEASCASNGYNMRLARSIEYAENLLLNWN